MFSHFFWRAGGLELFREFLRIEFSEENLEFWLACERYRLLFQPGDHQHHEHQQQLRIKNSTGSSTSSAVSEDTLNALLEDTALSSCTDAQSMKQLIFETYLAPLSTREARNKSDDIQINLTYAIGTQLV